MAQKSKADLKTLSNTTFPTNGKGEISAAAVRSYNEDMIDSMATADLLMNPAASTASSITLKPNDAISRDAATAVALNIPAATFTDGASATFVQTGAVTPTITATGLTVQYVGAWKSVTPAAGKKVCYTFQRVGTDLIAVRNLCSTTPQ